MGIWARLPAASLSLERVSRRGQEGFALPPTLPPSLPPFPAPDPEVDCMRTCTGSHL